MNRPKIVFSDFDDTLTYKGELTPRFFDIIKILESNNIPFVIVTGRSVSWAHFLLTHFPYLKHVIAEGGGVIVRRTSKGILKNDYLVDGKTLDKLRSFSRRLRKKFNVELTTDSMGRKSDRALELTEMLSDLEKYKKIKDYLTKENVNFSQSSVHLNFWMGDISKFNGVTKFIKDYASNVAAEQCVFFGDSMNDESMFRHFEKSVGVSNINLILKNLEYPPKTILQGDENIGPEGVYNYLVDAIK